MIRTVLVSAALALVAALIAVALLANRAAAPDPPAPAAPQVTGPTIEPDPPAIPLSDVFARAYSTLSPKTHQVAWAPRVTYLVGSQVVRAITAREAALGDLWMGCPPGVVRYTEYRCPIIIQRLLNGFVRDGARLVTETGSPKVVGCDVVSSPPRTAGLTAVSVRPDRAHRDCFSDFAITLYLNAHDQVEAVNFVLSSP